MRKCPFCAESIQEQAVVCKFCGRSLSYFRERSAARGRALVLLGGLLGMALIIAVAAGAFYMMNGGSWSQKKPAASAHPALQMPTPTRGRLFLQNELMDDATRNTALAKVLRDAGHRCGEVTKVVMISAGLWTVQCQEGGIYRLTFGKDARLESAVKLR